jgi:hypothetical protein
MRLLVLVAPPAKASRELPARLDRADAKALEEDIYTDEIDTRY